MEDTKENMDILKEESEFWFRSFSHAQERQNHTSDSFSAVQIQVAGMILTIGSIPISILKNDLNTYPWMLFGLGAISLVISLVAGIWGMHTKERFWYETADKIISVYRKYREARRGNISEKEVIAYRDGVMKGETKASSSNMPWKTQTGALFIGIVLVMLSFTLMFYQIQEQSAAPKTVGCPVSTDPLPKTVSC